MLNLDKRGSGLLMYIHSVYLTTQATHGGRHAVGQIAALQDTSSSRGPLAPSGPESDAI